MTVRRIVANVAAEDVAAVKVFYRALFDLDVLMDHGWVVTLGSDATTAPQISILSEGGSSAPVPDISIEVKDVDEVYRRAADSGAAIIYALTHEPWGVRRFFVRDPAGRLLNVLSHAPTAPDG